MNRIPARWMGTLLAVALTGSFAVAQSITITVTMSPRPDPYLSTWKTRQGTVVLTVSNSTPSTVQAKFKGRLLKDGELVAQTKDASMSVFSIPVGTSLYHADKVIPFDAVDFYGDAKTTAVKTSMLPSGAYQLCVMLVKPDNSPLTEERCSGFMLTDYQGPILLMPPDASMLQPMERPTFRWTPVSPSPPYAVRYRVQVFEVLQGQRPMQAFKVNQPILDKEVVGLNQMIWPPEYQLPGRVETYVWTVRALDDQGRPIGAPDGYAEPGTFRITTENEMRTGQEIAADGVTLIITLRIPQDSASRNVWKQITDISDDANKRENRLSTETGERSANKDGRIVEATTAEFPLPPGVKLARGTDLQVHLMAADENGNCPVAQYTGRACLTDIVQERDQHMQSRETGEGAMVFDGEYSIDPSTELITVAVEVDAFRVAPLLSLAVKRQMTLRLGNAEHAIEVVIAAQAVDVSGADGADMVSRGFNGTTKSTATRGELMRTRNDDKVVSAAQTGDVSGADGTDMVSRGFNGTTKSTATRGELMRTRNDNKIAHGTRRQLFLATLDCSSIQLIEGISGQSADSVPDGAWKKLQPVVILSMAVSDPTVGVVTSGIEPLKDSVAHDNSKAPEFLFITGPTTGCTSGDAIHLTAHSTSFHPGCSANPVWYNASPPGTTILQGYWGMSFQPTSAGWYAFTAQCPDHPNMSSVFNLYVYQSTITPWVGFWGAIHPPLTTEGYKVPCGPLITMSCGYPGNTGHPLSFEWSIISGAQNLTDVWTYNNFIKFRCACPGNCKCNAELLFTVRDVHGCIGKKTIMIYCNN